MLKKLLFLGVLLFSIISNAQEQQDVSVEKSIWGIQTGLLGLWGHNESRLSRKIALRSEVGLNGGFASGRFIEDGFQWILAPTLNVEPRWYYNLDKRSAKGKVTSKNTANFLSINLSYNPDWFLISSSSKNRLITSFSTTANWGIKRTLWEHFTYEFVTGLGYTVQFWKQRGYSSNENLMVLGLGFRLGYTF